MKNLFGICFVAILAFGLASCSKDDSCTQADWVGTYTLVGDSSCELDSTTTFTADPTLVVTAGSTEDRINVGGTDVTINEDNCSVTNIITVTKDGDTLTSTITDGCSFTYEKN